MKLIQPYPSFEGSDVPESDRASCSVPVIHVRSRHKHHAGPSGHDRLCDYIGQTLKLSRTLYWFGETVLRPICLYLAKFRGHYEYSRYDAIMEIEMLFHMVRHRGFLYHFIYGEKGFHLASHMKGRRGHLLVATLHHPPEHYEWLYEDPSILGALDHAIVMSRSQVDFVEHIVGKDRATFIPYGVDTKFFTPGSRAEETRTEIRIIFAGSHLRDVDTMVSCIPPLLQALPNITFDIVSRDPKFNSFEGTEQRVCVHRYLDDASYLLLMQRADILLLPLLRRSTACTTVLEAMACGVPIVTTEGGINDYLSDSYAITRRQGNADQLVKACETLARNPEMRLSMAVAARKAAETLYSWPVVARQHANLYESLYGRR